MIDKIICHFKDHDWEPIPEECLKEEYNLPVKSGSFCLRCGKSEVIKRHTKKDISTQRIKKVKSLFSKYLWPDNVTHNTGGAIVCAAPSPWDNPSTFDIK